MRIKIYIILIVLCFFCIFTYFFFCWENEKIYLVENKSFFMDYEVVNDEVYTYCELTIYNGFRDNQEVEIIAYDNDNIELGLIQPSNLIGYDKNTNNNIFILKKGENLVSVKFVGKFAGNYKRANRLLPNRVLINRIE